mmetsp:Transcript_49664/g.103615  ORF Transcript_49664/g.103615 Transcript_49664/m.103615 type:complete len:202 (-) Transcript_49664:384-989(-)
MSPMRRGRATASWLRRADRRVSEGSVQQIASGSAVRRLSSSTSSASQSAPIAAAGTTSSPSPARPMLAVARAARTRRAKSRMTAAGWVRTSGGMLESGFPSRRSSPRPVSDNSTSGIPSNWLSRRSIDRSPANSPSIDGRAASRLPRSDRACTPAAAPAATAPTGRSSRPRPLRSSPPSPPPQTKMRRRYALISAADRSGR